MNSRPPIALSPLETCEAELRAARNTIARLEEDAGKMRAILESYETDARKARARMDELAALVLALGGERERERENAVRVAAALTRAMSGVKAEDVVEAIKGAGAGSIGYVLDNEKRSKA